MDDLFFQTLLENLYDGVYYVDLDRVITYWNAAAERITGYRREDVIGRACAANILRHIDGDGQELCLHACPLAASMRDGQNRESQVYLHHRQGYRLPVSVRVSPVRDASGQIVGGVEVFSENRQMHQLQNDLNALKISANRDELTGVGNRRAAEMWLQTHLYELRSFEQQFGLIFIDLDHFKDINDRHGHPTGDQVLHAAAGSIAGALRHDDQVARWGGEEFIVLIDGVDAARLEKLAQRVRTFIERSFLMLGGEKLTFTASLGATLARPDDTPESLVSRADAMMYRSKEAGRNRVTVG
jgi:diguanylate cyclase (GGDEF)-like protein/PAS domain S-box-containing protein